MRQLRLAPVLVSLFCLAPLPAATPLFRASFENTGSAWTTLRGTATIDSAITHENQKSMRVEPGANLGEASVESAPIALTIGRRYLLTGWVRTDRLTVRDPDRTPVAIGAALTMASMPFDVHSESLGGTHDWNRV